VGLALRNLEEILSQKDEAALSRFLTGRLTIQTPLEMLEAGESHLAFGLETAEKMIFRLDERSESIRGYGKDALAYFDQSFDRYVSARDHFERLLPKWDIWFEHMMVNHMFFSRFPFQDRPVSLRDEFIALCAVYSLLRFLGIGHMRDKTDTSAFVDVASAVFRLVDHTSFERYASRMMKDLGCDDWSRIHDLISL